jgi:riboflavin transporter FmnP
MNKYVKEFLTRGMAFGGFGPIVAGIIYLILSHTLPDFALSGTQVFWAIVSTYLLAFLQAGASVFNQIEHWPLAKSLLCHFLTIYIAYVSCYLLNTWIPFEPMVLVVFTAAFIVLYFIIWSIVYFSVKAAEKKLNQNLH